MRASSSIGSISGNGVGAAALKRCRSSRSRLRRSQSIRDDVHSSRLDCPRLERRLRTCTRSASYSRNPAFRGSGRCATSRLPKLQSRQGSDTEPAGQMRSCQRQSRQGRHSLLARALGPARPAVARGTTSPAARGQERAREREQERAPVRGLRVQSRPAARCLRLRCWLAAPGIASRTAAMFAHSWPRWPWPLAIARRIVS